MSHIIYELSQSIVDVENKEYVSYGIGCGGDVLVRDISTNREFVEKLIKSFNDNHLDIVHIKDAVMDAI